MDNTSDAPVIATVNPEPYTFHLFLDHALTAHRRVGGIRHVPMDGTGIRASLQGHKRARTSSRDAIQACSAQLGSFGILSSFLFLPSYLP